MVMWICKQFKIFNSVIRGITVNMVNFLFGFKIAPKIFFHNKAMLGNNFFTITKGVFGFINKNISSIYSFTSFPIMIFIPNFFNTHCFFSFLRMIFAKHRIIFSRKLRTLFPLIPGNFSQHTLGTNFIFPHMQSFIPRNLTFMSLADIHFLFFSHFTILFHFITPKIKAVFSPQKRERLSSQDLLTADFRHKKSALSFAILSIAFILGLSTNLYAEVKWVKFSYYQNWGGLNDQLSATEIEDNEASDIQNIIFDTGGAVKKRYGYTTLPNDPPEKVHTGSAGAINGLTFYQKNNGNRYLIAIANSDSKATAMKKDYQTGGGVETGSWENIDTPSLPSSFTNNYTVDFAVAEDNLIITLQSTLGNYPFRWTGTGAVQSLTSDTDCPEASIVEYHKNQLFLSGNDDFPSRVWFSGLDDITSYTATDFFDVQTADGTRTRGLISAYDSLYIFKDKSIWRLSGYDRDSFILEKMVTGIGTLSQQSICLVNNVIYFTSAQGNKAVYDGAYTVKYISNKISNTISDLNLTRSNHALGINFEDNFYSAISDSGSDENNLVLLFDTDYNAWTKFLGINANTWCIGDDSDSQDALFFGDYDGYIHQYPSTGYYDGNVTTDSIVAFYQTKWFKYSNICLGDKKWRLLKTSALSELNNAYLYAECKADYEQSGKVVELQLKESGTLWDVGIWDVNTWSGQALKVGRHEINKGNNMFQIYYYNNNVDEGFTMFGFDIFIEPTERI